MKSYIAWGGFVLLVTVVMSFSLIASSENEPINTRMSSVSAYVSNARGSDANTGNIKTHNEHQCSGSEIATDPTALIKENNFLLPATLIELKNDPLILWKKAIGGDEVAAIGLFAFVQSCSAIRDYIDMSDVIDGEISNQSLRNCTAIPNEIRSNPLLSLEIAAENGSLRSKILYARNAPVIAKYLNFSEHKLLVPSNSKILEKAEMYAANAANSGVLSAYSLLAIAYQDGLFGKKDPVRSYAYALALSKLKADPENVNRVRYLYTNLKQSEVVLAEQTLRPCTSDVGTSNLSIRSPF
jgi:hypothetical protein